MEKLCKEVQLPRGTVLEFLKTYQPPAEPDRWVTWSACLCQFICRRTLGFASVGRLAALICVVSDCRARTRELETELEGPVPRPGSDPWSDVAEAASGPAWAPTRRAQGQQGGQQSEVKYAAVILQHAL